MVDPIRISAGQIQMFLPSLPHVAGCPRRWTLHYPCGMPRLGGPALDFGIVLHKALEQLSDNTREWPWPRHWTGKEPTETERDRAKAAVMAQAMFHHRPGTMFVTEPEYFMPDEVLGVEFYVKPDGHADRNVFIDWKSTSATSRASDWVLGDKDHVKPLRLNVQANLYALGLMQRWGTKWIDAVWVYGSKKFNPGSTPKTWTVRHRFTLKAAATFYDEVIRPTAQVMLKIREGIASGAIDSPLLLPHAGSSCEFQGKFCDVVGHCKLQPSPVKLGALQLPIVRK